MTDLVVHPATLMSDVASRCWRVAALLKHSLQRALIAYSTRRALNELSDDLLRDVGLTRGEIGFVADALASGHGDPTRDAIDRLNRSAAARTTEPTPATGASAAPA